MLGSTWGVMYPRTYIVTFFCAAAIFHRSWLWAGGILIALFFNYVGHVWAVAIAHRRRSRDLLTILQAALDDGTIFSLRLQEWSAERIAVEVPPEILTINAMYCNTYLAKSQARASVCLPDSAVPIRVFRM